LPLHLPAEMGCGQSVIEKAQSYVSHPHIAPASVHLSTLALRAPFARQKELKKNAPQPHTVTFYDVLSPPCPPSLTPPPSPPVSLPTHPRTARHVYQVMDTRHTVDDMPEILQKLNSANKVGAVQHRA
jgi:hypothetical protein